MTNPQLPARPENLADFDDPPLTEVAFAIQYERPKNYHELFVSEIWRNLFDGSKIPAPVEKTPPVFETFGSDFKDTRRSEIRFEQLRPPFENRYAFETNSGESVTHFQPDKVVKIWKKLNGSSYPRYETIRDDFVDTVLNLKDLFDKSGVGEFVPTQCELVYANFLKLKDVSKALQVFGIGTFGTQIEVEGFQASFSKILANSSDERWGRLHGNFWTTFDPEGDKAVQLNLTVRGAPFESTTDACWEFFHHARVEIVETFAHICSEDRGQPWKQTK